MEEKIRNIYMGDFNLRNFTRDIIKYCYKCSNRYKKKNNQKEPLMLNMNVQEKYIMQILNN